METGALFLPAPWGIDLASSRQKERQNRWSRNTAFPAFQRHDLSGLFSRYDSADALGGCTLRIVGEVSISRGCCGLRVAEQGADQGQSITSVDYHACVAVAKVM